MISRQKSKFYVAILRPQALLRHTNVAQERNQKLCLLYEIDGNIWLHREGKVLETGLLKKLRIDASKNRGLELACLENPAWDNGIPRLGLPGGCASSRLDHGFQIPSKTTKSAITRHIRIQIRHI